MLAVKVMEKSWNYGGEERVRALLSKVRSYVYLIYPSIKHDLRFVAFFFLFLVFFLYLNFFLFLPSSVSRFYFSIRKKRKEGKLQPKKKKKKRR